MTASLFGDFQPLFEPASGSVPGYLKLLHIRPGPEADATIRQLRQAIADAGDDLEAQLRPLFEMRNWRPQLVAAAALVVARSPGVGVDALWSALDKPCWTSPQLAAAALRADPSFVENARERMERRCLLDTTDDQTTSAIGRHSALGPSSIYGHSAKLMTALAALCVALPGTSAWLPTLLAMDDVHDLLSRDVDSGGKIALAWLDGLEAATG